jgi:major membrane immunogen (membrane-anchored lipoprotein)
VEETIEAYNEDGIEVPKFLNKTMSVLLDLSQSYAQVDAIIPSTHSSKRFIHTVAFRVFRTVND